MFTNNLFANQVCYFRIPPVWGVRGGVGICQAGWSMMCLIQKFKYFQKYSIRLEDLEALTQKGWVPAHKMQQI